MWRETREGRLDARTVALLTVMMALILAVGPAYATSLVDVCSGNLTVIIYGEHTCPHCMASYNGLKQLGVNVTFYDVQESKEAQKAWIEMFKRYFLPLGFNPGVPVIYVRCGNHSLVMLGGVEKHEIVPPGFIRIQPAPDKWKRLIEALASGEAPSAAGSNTSFVGLICASADNCISRLKSVYERLAKENRTSLAPNIVCVGNVALCVATNTSIEPVLPGTSARGTKANTTITAVTTHTEKQNETIKPGVNATSGKPREGEAGKLGSFLALVPLLVSLAAMDAINPCFLALYSITIAAVASIRGYRAAVATGLGVALGVFTGYYLLGLGLLTALEALPWLREALAVAVIVVGILTLVQSKGLLSEECLVCKLASKLRIGTAEMTPLLGYTFGFIASLTLLPCSAGPYAIAAIYLERYTMLLRLLGLLVYNVVFIAPILAMCFAASLVARYAWLQEKMRPFVGLLLIILGVYVILQPQLGIALGG